MTFAKPFNFPPSLDPLFKAVQTLAIVGSLLIVLYGGILKVGQGRQTQSDVSTQVAQLTADVRVLQETAAEQAVTAQALRDLRTQMEQQSQQTQDSINRLSDEINYMSSAGVLPRRSSDMSRYDK